MRKLMKYGKIYGGTDPEMIEGDVFKIIIKAPEYNGTVQTQGTNSEMATHTDKGPGRDQVGAKSGPSLDQVEILRFCQNEHPIGELMEFTGRTNRTKFRNQVLNPLLEAGWLEMTIPDKPTSSRQKYRATENGIRLIEDGTRGGS
jgi:ATP-dependent DNA helicase RecG